MGKFLILFIIITISEVYLMKIVAEKTGFLFLLAFVMFTGFLGISLAKMQGRMHWKKIQEEISQGKMPGNPLIEGLMILVAATVLITPGFITDLIGFMLLIPFVRRLFAPGIAKILKPKEGLSGGGFSFYSNANMPSMDESQSVDGSTQAGDFFDMPPHPEEIKAPESIEDNSKG